MSFGEARDEYERRRERERASLAACLAAHEGIESAGLHVATARGRERPRGSYGPRHDPHIETGRYHKNRA